VCWQRARPVASRARLKRKGAGYHHGDLRRALVEATSKLVDQRGPEEFTLRAAARLAGVSDGAPYHHFEDKEALLAAVSVDGFRLLREEMTAAAERHRGNARKKSLAMGVAYVRFAARHPERFRLMFGPLLHSKRRHAELEAAARDTHQLVREAFASGLAEDTGRAPPRHVPLCASALVHGLAVVTIDEHAEPTDEAALERMTWRALELVTQSAAAERDQVPPSGRRVRGGGARSSVAAKR
jgi:AcrR family transcriptional regulator